MVNEINGPKNLISGLTQQKQAEQAKTEETVKGNKPQSGGDDVVSLTDQAEKLKALEASIEKQPVVDTKRVEALRNAILEDNYLVNSERTAEKMLAFETLLDSKTGDK